MFMNARATCEEGRCQMGACLAGWVDLNGSPADGCETECVFQSDIDPPDTDDTRSYLISCDRSFGQYLFDALLDAGEEFGRRGHRPCEPEGATGQCGDQDDKNEKGAHHPRYSGAGCRRKTGPASISCATADTFRGTRRRHSRCWPA